MHFMCIVSSTSHVKPLTGTMIGASWTHQTGTAHVTWSMPPLLQQRFRYLLWDPKETGSNYGVWCYDPGKASTGWGGPCGMAHRGRDREGTSGGGHSMSKDQSNDRNFFFLVGGGRENPKKAPRPLPSLMGGSISRP